MPVEKIWQGWGDDQAPDATGNVDPEFASQAGVCLAEQVFRFFHIGDEAQASLVEVEAVLGCSDLARGAMEEARSDAILELDHGGGYGRSRQAKRIGRAREARTIHHAREDAKKFDTVHGRRQPHIVRDF
ncbi:hypothetical protein CHELA1G11_21656 [Hyphomicrobiales bacterium]|nr:hypothetical protein CHELA1G11_21656 [Hyphomicrobiales bacterium]CAH1695361.1 hypothetical protein CHELA1G2_21960 [Hyphomicrobiales bacterium]